MWVFVILNASWGLIIICCFEWRLTVKSGKTLSMRCFDVYVANIGNSNQTTAGEKCKLHTRVFSCYLANFMAVCVHFVWLHVQVFAYSRMLSVPFPVSNIENPTFPPLMLTI